MREHRQPARAMDQPDRIDDREAVLADVRGPAVAEIAIEGIAEIHRPPLGDHGARDVRAADGATSGLLENGAELDANTELVEALHDTRGSRATHLAELDELRFHFACVAQVQSENVCFHIALDRAQLHAGDHANVELGAHASGFRDPVERVVIGERDRRETHALRFADDVRGCARAIGRSRMRVQVDERSALLDVRGRGTHAW